MICGILYRSSEDVNGFG